MTGEPIHLGKELCENLDVLGMSPAELCRRIEVPVSRITEIVNVRRAVTGDTALRPCRVFGTSGQFWLNPCLSGYHPHPLYVVCTHFPE